MNECPSVPHGSEQEEEEEMRDHGGGGGGTKGDSSGSFSFSTAAGTRRALSALTCPHVDPSRELSDLTWSSSKRFSPSVPPPPPYPVFFRPQKWLRRFNMAVFVSFFLALSRVFPFFFFFLFFSSAKGRSRGIAHSVAPFNLRRILCGGLRLGVHPLRSARERVLREKGNTYHV